ncbi:hypothetical protein J4558_00585 [Leptolyngbya sp. 15MV]|nr:hypothetical protein J4558_00585 [Leptolyngbya sp. 15MV]
MDNHGSLVGWTHRDLGDKILLCVESVRSVSAADAHKPDVLRVLLTKNQAAVLGNFLIQVSDRITPTPRSRGLLRRLFG